MLSLQGIRRTDAEHKTASVRRIPEGFADAERLEMLPLQGIGRTDAEHK